MVMILGRAKPGIPYVTLCGSAQAYYTDNLPADVIAPFCAPQAC